MLKLCLRFNDTQSIYVSKHYAYQASSGSKICDFFNGEYAMTIKLGLLVYFSNEKELLNLTGMLMLRIFCFLKIAL